MSEEPEHVHCMHNAAPQKQSLQLAKVLARAASIIMPGKPSIAMEIKKLKELVAMLVKQLKKATEDIKSLKRGMTSTGALSENKIPSVQPKKRVVAQKRV